MPGVLNYSLPAYRVRKFIVQLKYTRIRFSIQNANKIYRRQLTSNQRQSLKFYGRRLSKDHNFYY